MSKKNSARSRVDAGNHSADPARESTLPPDGDNPYPNVLAWAMRLPEIVAPLLPLLRSPTNLKVALAAAAAIRATGGRLRVVQLQGSPDADVRIERDQSDALARMLFASPDRAAAFDRWLPGFIRRADALGITIAILDPDFATKGSEDAAADAGPLPDTIP